MKLTNCPNTHRLIRHLLVKLAPVILGVKPSGLLRLTNCRHLAGGRQFDLFCVHQQDILDALKLECLILKRNGGNLVVFFFRRDVLGAHLARPETAEFLRERGYRSGSELDELVRRCRGEGGFPHEIGAFLGYPLKDVRGFLENPAGCLAVPRGLWRVAGDPAESLAVMEAYRGAENYVKELVDCGKPLAATLRKIHNTASAA